MRLPTVNPQQAKLEAARELHEDRMTEHFNARGADIERFVLDELQLGPRTERQLWDDFPVSQCGVRRALQRLIRRGLVERSAERPNSEKGWPAWRYRRVARQAAA